MTRQIGATKNEGQSFTVYTASVLGPVQSVYKIMQRAKNTLAPINFQKLNP